MPMELDFGTRPLSIHRSRDWHNQGHAGPSTNATTSSILSRRRSTAVHVPPPGPPPSQPIPHLPPTFHGDSYGVPSIPSIPPHDPSFFEPDDDDTAQQYARPSPSANLAAVAAFSQSRTTNLPRSMTASSSTENLSDPPPPSMLQSGPRSPVQTHDIVPDRLLLSPPAPRTNAERRPSSRSALTRALELARQAVQLDSTNDDPHGAVLAYGKSVALLSEVMERVMRGEDSSESSRRRNGRRRSVVAQEEEVRRLKAIHDTYAERMNILSLIYSIPIPDHSPSSYSSSISASTESTRPSSPASTSPTSELSDEGRSRTSSFSSRESTNDFRASSETERMPADQSDGMLAIGTAMFTLDTSLSPRTPVGPSTHPYATPSTITPSRSPIATPPRSQIGRPRASSTLPPPAPPPTSTLPPAPLPSPGPPDSALDLGGQPGPSRHLDPATAGSRQRGQSVSHRRAGSNSKLTALQEEGDKRDDHSQFQRDLAPAIDPEESDRQRPWKRDSHPLPPLPSPSASSIEVITPRNRNSGEYPSNTPLSASHFIARPRGDSTLSTRSELIPSTTQLPLINSSTTMGTIFQRRNKTSVPPSSPASGTTSPTESTSSASVPAMSKLTASSLPASTANSLGMTGRSRASSQPGRRPSVAPSSYPSLPTSVAPTQTTARKVSIPSKLNPNAPQITINTALFSPPLPSSSVTTPLVPPPPIPHANIPNAPLSPLPPLAPPDPLRKPYHMMNLLRQTMSSKTGGYVTRRLHVPQEVWSQGGAKLSNIPEKIRVVEVLCSALEELQTWSVEYFGAGNVSSGMVLGIGSIGKKEGEAWETKLEEFSSVCDGVVGNFGKKLGVGEGFVTKKSSGMTSWGGKLTRQFDKFTNGKNLDSPATYVQGLTRLFAQAQILDEHTKALLQSPPAPLYASFPPNLLAALDLKLKHASEFFARVVLTFVIRDMALLLDKYVKKCEKWLAE
ncbi:hypothetical protein BXZ70DRAFT_937959 [Cristinia sonorae]|uniref:MIT domain-containing protein n=1 Tax=Cristinia sonorae TaxID=1940300 RepID=A0A8K0XQ00_9AGAR|nr:hypothetical protein BXZ70DRAFT_937959 [Cristinia sonorae]